MERVLSNFNFSTIETILENLDADHSSSRLSKLKSELNKFFNKAHCNEVLYTLNTDKLFFGMRVYPVINGDDAMEILSTERSKLFEKYVIEIDSKLTDPMLALDGKELTAILLHEVGHIVYDTGTIDEVKNQVDMYFANTGDTLDVKSSSKGYRELMGYALKDAVMKTGSIFCKFGDTEMIADSFVAGCGYGPYLESGMRKVSASSYYINKDVDERFLTLSWVLRLKSEFDMRRIPAIKTLNKAKGMTASKLEQRELTYAANIISRTDLNEGAIDNVRERFDRGFMKFKAKGIKGLKDDVYELNLILRTAEDPDDLFLIIRRCNNNIAIIQDYMSEDITEAERKDCQDTLAQYYDIRQRAAKDKSVRDRYSSMINVVYTN